MVTNLIHRHYVQGGSTITQQVAKNLFLTSQKSIKRKVQELLLAFWLEHKFTKDQILALYMNRVYLGNGAYGIESAANKYFQKASNDLNLHEAAILAGMLKAPSRYNPIASKEKSEARAKIVLQNMVNAGLITDKQMTQALTMRLGPEVSDKVSGGKYFADWIYQDVNGMLGEREEDIYVHTTLDQDIQESAEKILEEAIAANIPRRSTASRTSPAPMCHWQESPCSTMPAAGNTSTLWTARPTSTATSAPCWAAPALPWAFRMRASPLPPLLT